MASPAAAAAHLAQAVLPQNLKAVGFVTPGALALAGLISTTLPPSSSLPGGAPAPGTQAQVGPHASAPASPTQPATLTELSSCSGSGAEDEASAAGGVEPEAPEEAPRARDGYGSIIVNPKDLDALVSRANGWVSKAPFYPCLKVFPEPLRSWGMFSWARSRTLGRRE